jgi:hypothetical protein
MDEILVKGKFHHENVIVYHNQQRIRQDQNAMQLTQSKRSGFVSTNPSFNGALFRMDRCEGYQNGKVSWLVG